MTDFNESTEAQDEGGGSDPTSSPATEQPQRQRRWLGTSFSIRFLIGMIAFAAVLIATWTHTIRQTTIEQRVLEIDWPEAQVIDDFVVAAEFQNKPYAPDWLQQSVGYWVGPDAVKRCCRIVIPELPEQIRIREVRSWGGVDLQTIARHGLGEPVLKSTPDDLERTMIQFRLSKLDQFRQFRRLRFLELQSAAGLDSFSPLRQLTQLESLSLFQAQDLQSLDGLENLTQLQALSLDSGPDLADASHFKSLKRLQHLSLGMKLADVSGLGELVELRELRITGASQLQNLECFSGLERLEQLWIDDASALTSLRGIQSLKNLRLLSLGNCPQLKHLDSLPVNLAQLRLFNCRGLEHLELGRCDHLKELMCSGMSGLKHPKLSGELPSLMKIELQECANLISLKHMQHQPTPRSLNLIDCPQLINLEGIGQFSQLKMLKIHGCTRLANLDGLNEQCPELRQFELHGCPSLIRITNLNGHDHFKVFRILACSNLRLIENSASLDSLDKLLIESCDSFQNLSGPNQLKMVLIADCDQFQGIYSTTQLSISSLVLDRCKLLVDCRRLTGVQIQSLSLQACPNLVSLAGLSQIRGLKHVDSQFNQRLGDLSAISQSSELKTFSLDGTPVPFDEFSEFAKTLVEGSSK